MAEVLVIICKSSKSDKVNQNGYFVSDFENT